MPSCQIVLHPFLLRHPKSKVSWHQLDLNLDQIWWLEHISKSYNTGLLWCSKVMSCLAHLAGGPTVIVSWSARLAILPWGNCKTYSISCSWGILCVSIAWSLPDDHVNAILKHVCGTPVFNKNIWSATLNFHDQLSKHHCMGKPHQSLPILSERLHTWSLIVYIMLCLSMGRIYPWNMCFKHTFHCCV